jgi:hypothetical protein
MPAKTKAEYQQLTQTFETFITSHTELIAKQPRRYIAKLLTQYNEQNPNEIITVHQLRDLLTRYRRRNNIIKIYHPNQYYTSDRKRAASA